MSRLFPDTTPEAEQVLLKGYRTMTPAQKLQRVVALNRAVEALATARLRARYGEMTDHERRLRLGSRKTGVLTSWKKFLPSRCT